jgi:protein-L-isoaspartate(D-aspartate) O-methyltransferase
MAVTDAEKIRFIMALRNTGITDRAVLSAMEQTPRERFIPAYLRDQAYEDTALPIDCDQTISQPSIVAWMSWALEANDRMRVLEIGTGSGYQAAVLSKLFRMVYTIERHRDLYEKATETLLDIGLKNINAKLGDGSKGWPEAAPFQRIILTAAAPEIPKALLDQLADGGIMVAPVGPQSGTQMLLRIKREGEQLHMQQLMTVRFVPLV